MQIRLTVSTVDLDRRLVLRDGRVQRLTVAEHRLIAHLASRPGRAIPREELLVEAWGYAREVASRAVDAAVLRLRRKIEQDPKRPTHLLSVYGVGYRFEICGSSVAAL